MRAASPSLWLPLLLSQLFTLALASPSDSTVHLRKVSDEVFGDTGGTGGDSGGGALWARGEVEAGQASAKTTTGFSTVIKPSATASATSPTASATKGDLLASATALPAKWYHDLETLSFTTKLALAFFISLSIILLVSLLTMCFRRRSADEEERDEVPPMAFDDRATTLPKSKNSYRRRSYRLFDAPQ